MGLCEVDDPHQKIDDVTSALRVMDLALEHRRESLGRFYYATRAGDWLQAEEHRLAVLSYMEAAMDAYTRACRSQRP